MCTVEERFDAICAEVSNCLEGDIPEVLKETFMIMAEEEIATEQELAQVQRRLKISEAMFEQISSDYESLVNKVVAATSELSALLEVEKDYKKKVKEIRERKRSIAHEATSPSTDSAPVPVANTQAAKLAEMVAKAKADPVSDAYAEAQRKLKQLEAKGGYIDDLDMALPFPHPIKDKIRLARLTDEVLSKMGCSDACGLTAAEKAKIAADLEHEYWLVVADWRLGKIKAP